MNPGNFKSSTLLALAAFSLAWSRWFPRAILATSPRSETIYQDQELISATLCQSFGSETGLVWFGPEISGPDGRLPLHYF